MPQSIDDKVADFWIGNGAVISKYSPKGYLPKEQYKPKTDYQSLPYWIQ